MTPPVPDRSLQLGDELVFLPTGARYTVATGPRKGCLPLVKPKQALGRGPAYSMRLLTRRFLGGPELAISHEQIWLWWKYMEGEKF